MASRREIPEISIRSLLVDEWNPSNTGGYGPGRSPGSGYELTIHTGTRDETIDDPQIAIDMVSETPRSDGYSGIKASGEGRVQTYDGLLDLSCWAGSDESMFSSDDLFAFELATFMTDEIRRIVSTYSSIGLHHPETGELQYAELVPRQRRRLVDDSDQEPEVFGRLQEVGYTFNRGPREF